MTAVRARRRPGRWLVVGLCGLVVVLLLGVAWGENTGWPLLRGPLQRQASSAAQVPVLLQGPFHLRLVGTPHLRVGQLSVAAAMGVPAPHLMQADDAQLTWRWGDLWRWRQGAPLRIHTLTAKTLDLRLLRLADGRASWALGAAKTAQTAAETALPLPRFGRLQVEAGRVMLTDEISDTALQAALTGGESDGTGAAKSSADTSVNSSEYHANITGRWRALPVRLAVRMNGAMLLLQDGTEGSPAAPLGLRVEGTAGAARLLFDGQAVALLGARQLDGALRFEGPSLAAVGAPLGVTLPRTPAFKLEGRLAHEAGVWLVRADTATIGRSSLGGDFRYDTRASPTRLSGRLSGRRLVLADLGPAVGTAGEGRTAATAATVATATTAAAVPAPQTAPGRVLPQRRFDLPSLRAMDADVAVAIDTLDLGSTTLAPLQAVRTRVLLQGGVLHLQGLEAGVAGGRLAGNTKLDGRTDPARWDVDLRVSALDMAGWVRALQTPAGEKAPPPRGKAALQRERRAALQERTGASVPPVRAYLTGLLSGDFQLHGQGTSTAQILANLQGQARLQLSEGTLSHLVTELAGIDLAQTLGVLVRGDSALPLRCARLELDVNKGVAQVRRGVLDNADSTLRLEGQIDLRNEALALRARVRPKDFSLLALRTPLLVTGTLAQPQVGLDGRRLGARAAGAVALAIIAAPMAALLPLLDMPKDEPGDPCAPSAAPAPKR